jgi:hypothetical protein
MANNVKSAWQILVIAIWISFSETIRWVFYSKPHFDVLYRGMGLELPNKPINGILWIIWGIIIAIIVYALSRKFSLLHTTLLTWLAVFFMAWIMLWNYAILPLDILWVVIPLSLLEVFIAALISKKLQGQSAAKQE